jgi:hypothetical protein
LVETRRSPRIENALHRAPNESQPLDPQELMTDEMSRETERASESRSGSRKTRKDRLVDGSARDLNCRRTQAGTPLRRRRFPADRPPERRSARGSRYSPMSCRASSEARPLRVFDHRAAYPLERDSDQVPRQVSTSVLWLFSFVIPAEASSTFKRSPCFWYRWHPSKTAKLLRCLAATT